MPVAILWCPSKGQIVQKLQNVGRMPSQSRQLSKHLSSAFLPTTLPSSSHPIKTPAFMLKCKLHVCTANGRGRDSDQRLLYLTRSCCVSTCTCASGAWTATSVTRIPFPFQQETSSLQRQLQFVLPQPFALLQPLLLPQPFQLAQPCVESAEADTILLGSAGGQ